jgi:iron complex outermembrane receptor protein
MRRISFRRARRTVSHRTLAAFLLGSAALSQAAYAQTDASGPAANASTPTIETITVTARRQAESLQKVPVAITAFDQDTLTKYRVQTLYDLMDYVPSATVSGYQTRDQQWITIRGQGETGFYTGGGVGGGPAVVTYLSEVPDWLVGPGIYYDLSSVQVLAGPQGTLFGRNTTGGAVLFEPKKPDDQFGGYGQVDFGSYDLIDAQAAVNIPIDDGLALRVAGNVGQQSGFTKDIVKGTDYDNQGYDAFRVGLLYQPTTSLTNYLLVNYVNYKNHGPGEILIAANPAIAPEALPYLAAQQARGVRRTELGVAELDQGRDLNLINKTDYAINGDLTIRNIVSYSQHQTRKQEDEDGTPIAIIDSLGSWGNAWNVNLDTFTEEMQLKGQSFGQVVSWQTGAYYENIASPQLQTFTQQFFTFYNHTPSTEHDHSEAVYAHAIVDLGSLLPGLQFSAGDRYTWDSIGFTLGDFGGTSPTSGPQPMPTDFCLLYGASPTNLADCRRGAHTTNSGDSYDFGLNYQMTPSTMIYATARQGYKQGGFNMVAAELGDSNAFAYKPEYVDDIEIGLKSDWSLFGMAARTNIALYDSKYRDAQVLSSTLVAGTVQGITINAAKATIRGLEFQSTFLPTDDLELNLTYSYIDAFFNSYTSGLGADLTNTPYPYAPKNKVAVGFRYRLPFDPKTGEVWLGANYTYQSSTFVGLSPGVYSPAAFAPGYGLLNLRLDWEHVFNSQAGVSLWVTNATDKVYETTVEDLYNSVGTSVATFGAPRMYGATIRYSF